MENKELHFLTKISDILVKEVDTAELALELKTVLETYVKINNLKVFVFDDVTSTMRDCADSWKVIEDDSEIYSAFENIKEHDFVINSKAYKLPPSIGEVTLKVSSLVMPMLKEGNVFGLIELEFDDDTSVDMEFLFLMRIFAAQASLKLQNIILNEQSKINVEFHDSMKNIAKIIETQYELNYIVPLIGEMLDRFISDHLIYVFLKQDNEFKLVWPKACKDERIYETLKQLTPETNYILTSDDKIGAFPLTSDGEITGCIVARSTLDNKSCQHLFKSFAVCDIGRFNKLE